ncbi:MAG TPA: hypothetical protein VD973_19545 [Symbiobacteriaceae bacterium]|nr:hypothetical protein [Symbiobacteriaceae bacterium]
MKNLAIRESILRTVVDLSKQLINVKKSGGVEAYLRQLWKAKAKQQEAIALLPTSRSLSKVLGHAIGEIETHLDELEGSDLILRCDLGSEDEPHFLASLEAVALTGGPLGSADEVGYRLSAGAQEAISSTLRYETYGHFLDSLTGEERLNAKMTVFGVFLLLSGAVTRSSALRIEFNEASNELEYLDALTQHLDEVSKALFPKSYESSRGRKSGKAFRAGDLDKFFRRRKQLEQAVGADVFVFDPPRYFFELYRGESDPHDGTTRTLLHTLATRIRELCVDDEWAPANFRELVRKYAYDNPVKVAHRQALFSAPPPMNWLFSFEYYLEEVLKDL